MKRGIRILVLAVIFAIFYSVTANADILTSSNIINIDGDFSDWDGAPYYSDPKNDNRDPSRDILGFNYIADDNYLYLKVERHASSGNSEPWEFSIVMLNALKGTPVAQYPNGQDKPIYAPQFDIGTSFNNNGSQNGALVAVSLDGQTLEQTFSSSNNGKTVEFRIPLSLVGLEGKNKEIEFIPKAGPSGKNGETDWVGDGRTIIVTTGPTLWKASYIFLFAGASYAAYRVFQRKKVF